MFTFLRRQLNGEERHIPFCVLSMISIQHYEKVPNKILVNSLDVKFQSLHISSK